LKESRPRGRVIHGLAAPLLFAEVGEAAVQFTDTAFIGRIGSAELAAIGLADSMLELALAPAIGLADAMQIVVARRAGQGRETDIAPTFVRTLRLVLVIALAVAALLHIGTRLWVDDLVASPAVATAVGDFFRYGAVGVVFLSLSLAYSSLLVGIGRTRSLVAATLLLVGSNVVLGWALVLGGLGFPRLGIEGAGIAFAAAEAITLAYLAIRTARQLGVGGRALLARRLRGGLPAGRVARIGWPLAGQVLIETVRWVGFFLIIERLGEDALAASSMVYACYALLLIPTYAFSETAYALVSNLIGRQQAREIPALVRTIVARAHLATLPLAAIAVAFPATALSIFTDDPSTIDAATGPLRLVGLVMLVVVPGDIWLAALFGTGATITGSAIELLASAIMLTSAYLAGIVLDLELSYVWATLALTGSVSLTAAYAGVKTGRWTPHAL
jgi:MATE family multidrug resistance protein